ncbi:FMN-binding negative transcriptional regulator [Nonomuraea muscovyensis]|uniref:Transcriptional regulator n=1 Tax=Nonomuraea muscovyensis TaxID=1124761 RepID=A0A7X0C3H3_9ACTN|nr:FMN-binding negative transcriptional regulator [Nonomuraea muscovyensis]MBB6346770.1 transcriptional regulator [Nonomuraea muscovyensis]
MLEQPMYALDDPAALRALVAAHGWALLVSDGGPVVSHLPIIPDPADPGAAVLGHLAREDAELHGLGERPVVIVVQGPHGYVSPTWYEAGPYVPTWNFVTVHLHGTPELLGPEETWQVLSGTVDHFEAGRPEPFRMGEVEEYARRLAPAVTGFRLVPTRVVGKAKLSQDKPAEIVERVIGALDAENPPLARAMRGG